MENKIVHIQIDDWDDMGEANQYLDEIMAGEHDNDVNYAEYLTNKAIKGSDNLSLFSFYSID